MNTIINFIKWLDWEAVIGCTIILLVYGIVRIVTDWIITKRIYSKKNMLRMLDIMMDDEVMDRIMAKSIEAAQKIELDSLYGIDDEDEDDEDEES